MPLAARLLAALAATDLAQPGRRALVAVSGGADSVALLDLLAATRDRHGLELVAAHVDHGIDPRSGAVAEGVAALAARLGVPLVRGRLRLGAGAGETLARIRRHRWLEAARRRTGADLVLLAHHADDQAETVLMRVLRGSAPAGLAGIRPVRGRLVRPLLGLTRTELRAHCAARGLPWWDDPANGNPVHLRSWLRGQLLPAVRGRLPAADAALVRVSEAAAADCAAWDAVLDLLPGLAPEAEPGGISVVAPVLAGYHSQLAGAVVRGLARRAGCPLGPARAARVVAWLPGAGSGATLPLGGAWLAELAFGRLRLVRRPQPAPGSARLAGLAGALAWGAWRLAWRTEPAPREQPRDGWTAWVIPGEVALRAPMPGDRVEPLGGAGRRLVVREMQDRKVPRSRRAGWPVLVRDDELLWVPGVCRASAALPAGEPTPCEWMSRMPEVLRRTGGRPVKSIVFDEGQIAGRVRELGAEITAAYPDGELLVLGLLKGSFIFLGDLVRQIERPVTVDFLVASSYGAGTVSSGDVRLAYDPCTDLAGKHILLVEDIIDSGNTLKQLAALLQARHPRSLAVCALLHKRLVTDLGAAVRFVGFDAPPAFLVGYGLDHAENYRHLPFIADLA